MRNVLTTVLFILAAVVAVGAQDLAPGTRYDPRIPSLEKITGHDWGGKITTPEEIVQYFKALVSAAPERALLIEYARSWEGRPLHVLVIASPARISRLDQIKADIQRFADPRSISESEADRMVLDLPVITWLMHGVHGNEISSPEAAMAEAYHLLAAQGDPAVDLILRESIVLIDPLENPDGRARFVYQNLLGQAATPDPEPASAEHDEPWPGGRVNHYLFDMNRDWFAQSQLETRGRTKFYLEWYPQVVADLHEMGGDSTYYFAPPADPLNPHITDQQAKWLEEFGRQNGLRFDDRGFAYFIREVFDSFYPGYGESWPIFHGAIGMTYEMASARGLSYRRQDETILTYREGTVHHFVAAITTAETAARNREKLLRDFLDYRRSAVREGEQGPLREYLIPPGRDGARTARLARLLVAQGIEVLRAGQTFQSNGRNLPAGTYIIPAAQPAGRMMRNLLDPDTPQPEEFVKEQERRIQKGLRGQFYDLTGWSLPFLFDAEVLTSDNPTRVSTTPVAADHDPAPAVLPAAKVGYLMPWGFGTAEAVIEALQKGIKVRSASMPFKLGGREYDGGTAIVRRADNEENLVVLLGDITARHGAEAVPIDSAFVDEGISLGSNQVATLKRPRVLLAWDRPASSSSAGWARYILERRYGQPVTAVRVSSLARVDMGRYDVLILPAGNYSQAFTGDRMRRLKDWIGSGGTLITLGEASRWASREDVGLLSTKTLLRDGSPEGQPGDKKKSTQKPTEGYDLEAAIKPDSERPLVTPGAVLKVLLDKEHWLSAGTDGEIQVIVEGSRVFAPIKLNLGRNVGVFAKKDELVRGGLVWEEAQKLLEQKAFLMHQPTGRGHVIAFAEDPNYRAFAEISQLLFINAVLLGPAH